LEVADFSGEALGSLDTCHHSDADQILTTTDAPTFPLVRVRGREVGGVKIHGWIINALKLIMMLARRGVRDDLFRSSRIF